MSSVAILKHIAVKNSNYGQMQQYLLFQHERDSGKPILDEDGRYLPRDGILMEGINCDPFGFSTECIELNRIWGKNQSVKDIKAHHYIISFDPRDVTEHGLTPEKVQAIGMEFANRFFAGHQVLVVTHTDGHNHTGNLHCHIVLNSLRKLTVSWEDFMERPIDAQAGYKHNPTMKLIRYMLNTLNDVCEREHLHTLDLSMPADIRVTDREYHQQAREQEKLDIRNADVIADGLTPKLLQYANAKDRLRAAIDNATARARNEEEFLRLLEEEHKIRVRSKRGVYTYTLHDYPRGIRGRSLGLAYERKGVLERIAGRYPDRDAVSPEFANMPRIFLIHSDLRLVVDLQNCVKAQQSRAYARKVEISNLQEMARTVAFIQEQGIDSIEKLRKALSDAESGYQSTLGALRETEEQLKSVNEGIHHLGVYLNKKKLYRDFLDAKDKGAFRAIHRKDIGEYEGSTQFLKNHYGERGFPSMKALKAEKTRLSKLRSDQKMLMHQSRETRNQMTIIQNNVKTILGQHPIRANGQQLL